MTEVARRYGVTPQSLHNFGAIVGLWGRSIAIRLQTTQRLSFGRGTRRLKRPLPPSDKDRMVELIASLIVGLAGIGLGVFHVVAPLRMARINVRYNRG